MLQPYPSKGGFQLQLEKTWKGRIHRWYISSWLNIHKMVHNFITYISTCEVASYIWRISSKIIQSKSKDNLKPHPNWQKFLEIDKSKAFTSNICSWIYNFFLHSALLRATSWLSTTPILTPHLLLCLPILLALQYTSVPYG